VSELHVHMTYPLSLTVLQLNVLSKTAAIVVPKRLCVPEAFEDYIGFHEAALDLVSELCPGRRVRLGGLFDQVPHYVLASFCLPCP